MKAEEGEPFRQKGEREEKGAAAVNPEGGVTSPHHTVNPHVTEGVGVPPGVAPEHKLFPRLGPLEVEGEEVPAKGSLPGKAQGKGQVAVIHNLPGGQAGCSQEAVGDSVVHLQADGPLENPVVGAEKKVDPHGFPE